MVITYTEGLMLTNVSAVSICVTGRLSHKDPERTEMGMGVL